MTYLPPDIIDNNEKTLAEALVRTVLETGQRRLDIATGYFAPDVWRLVGAALTRLDAFRMLIGERPDVRYGGEHVVDLRRYYRRKIADDIAGLAFDPQHARLVDALLAFLTRPAAEVRLFHGAFLHAKAYIFDRVSYVGSSNFTIAGLTHNSELMLSSTSEATANSLRHWFEDKWAESEDYKADLIATLQESKFGSKPYAPHDVFIKALYEYFRGRIGLDGPEATAAVDLARFQEEGRTDAIRLLESRHGVLVADAVGLGKTYIGLSLLEHEIVHKRSKKRIPRALVICPAQLRELVWKPRLAEFGIPVVDILSQEEIGRENFDWRRYRDVDVVLVDESHNFRNPNTQRYQTLSKIIAGGRRKQVILMTATPVNNTLWDLYYQISLLARGDDRYYRTAGISNLRGYFKGAVHGGIELFDLLEETTVRRSRSDIRRRQESGEPVIVGGREVRFPERRLERIDYDLDGTYSGFYPQIMHAIEELNLVAYNLAAYERAQTKDTAIAQQRNQALIALMKMLYLKRLESSAAAFETSIERQARFQERFLAMLERGRLLDAAHYRQLLAVEADDERPRRAEEIIEDLPEVDATAYDMASISSRVRNDIANLTTLVQRVREVRAEAESGEGDDKLRAVKQVLAGKLKGRKVLIFTSYHDTAAYIHRRLTEDIAWRQTAGEPVIGLITGDTKADERQRIVEHFAPIANAPADVTGSERKLSGPEIQVLISTDVLSEGQNLQDAGVVLNYDLHWNPVRLIQRAGRVDRIGSSFGEIFLYNVFPEDELEGLLGLVSRLTMRIAAIDRSVGLDASVLGEVISERSLEQLRQLHKNDQAILSDLERQAELVSTEEMRFPLLAHIQQIGRDAVEEIPMGIHSGKRYRARVAQPGWFFAFSARDRHLWRFYPDDGGEPVVQLRAIYPMIECAPSEERVSPGDMPYALLERATTDVLKALHAERARQRTSAPLTGISGKLYNWINRPSLWTADTLDRDSVERLLAVLTTVPLQPFRNDKQLKALVKTYETTSDFARLLDDLDAFCAENALYQDITSDERMFEELKAEDVRLICFERLVPAR